MNEFEFTDEELKFLKPLEQLKKGIDEKISDYFIKVVSKRLGIKRGTYRFNFNVWKNKIQVIPQRQMFTGHVSPPKMARRYPFTT